MVNRTGGTFDVRRATFGVQPKTSRNGVVETSQNRAQRHQWQPDNRRLIRRIDPFKQRYPSLLEFVRARTVERHIGSNITLKGSLGLRAHGQGRHIRMTPTPCSVRHHHGGDEAVFTSGESRQLSNCALTRARLVEDLVIHGADLIAANDHCRGMSSYQTGGFRFGQVLGERLRR